MAIRIACVGDSTEGTVLPRPEIEAWPAVLQRLLRDRALVRNFGVGGATISKGGDKPYWGQPAYAEACGWSPRLVLVMLGTNDARSANTGVCDEVLGDLRSLLMTIADLPSEPGLVLCTPLPSFRANHTVDPPYIADVLVPGMRALAHELQVELLDVNRMAGDLGPCCGDGIHPDAWGTARIAHLISWHLASRM